jgi:hypothetical protein
MERVDTISEVETKTLDSGKTLYIAKDSQGREYSTTYRQLAQVAEQAVVNGEHVHLTFKEEKTDRGFIRRYLNGIEVVPDGTLAGSVADAMERAQTAATRDDGESALPGISEKDLLILKQVALKAGVESLQHLPEEQRKPTAVASMAEYYALWIINWRP